MLGGSLVKEKIRFYRAFIRDELVIGTHILIIGMGGPLLSGSGRPWMVIVEMQLECLFTGRRCPI
jgi:hypothetical protein